jgi:hypothetical protein
MLVRLVHKHFKIFIMKIITTLLLSACTVMVMAQKNKQSLHQDIDDDGKTLTIKINGTTDGKTISYRKQFNVAGMSQQAREAIVSRITDSLGIKRNVHTPVPPVVPAHSSTTSVTSSVHTTVREHGDTMTLKIIGTRNNAPLNYDRTFKVKGMSKQEKDAIVRRITDSLGVGSSTR